MIDFDKQIQIEGAVLVRFSVEKGCGFCDKYKPVFEAFKLANPNIKCIDITKPTLQTPAGEVESKFDVKSYPTTISFVNGKLVAKESGVLSPEKLLNMVKTLQNISDKEIVGIKFDLNIEIATQEKKLYELKSHLFEVEQEIIARQTPPSQPVQPPVSPQRQALIDHLNEVKSTNKECNDKCDELCKDNVCQVECEDWCKHIRP